ncbi:MAG: THUMP domain-containing protein [Bacteroidota bacterium]
MQLLAKTYQGLEAILGEELQALGAKKIEILHRAVRFEGNQKVLYRANYEARTALRILVPIRQFKTKHENHFYRKMQEIDWRQYLNLKTTFAINAVTSSKYLRHSKYLALKSKDAIVDQLRPHFDGQRPYVDTKNPDFRFNVHIAKDNLCTVSLDSSGASLYKRGYRVASVEAPMSEVLAAGMVLLTGWRGEKAFVDPMCGSGTIPIEAALIACNIPPQWKRAAFGFQKWQDFDPNLWEKIKSEAQSKIRKAAMPIVAYDQDFNAFQATSKNIDNANLKDSIRVVWKKLEKLENDLDSGILVMNPPYNERLAEADMASFYSSIGDQLKQKFTGFDAWIISSDREALKSIGLKTSRKIVLFNGPLECRFQKYELYSGSRRVKQGNEEVL